MHANFADEWIAARIVEDYAMEKTHEFTLILTSEPDEEQADRLYGRFNDGTIATSVGVPHVDFHRIAPSLEDAIRTAIADIRSEGFEVIRVEIEPETVAQAS